LPGHSDRTSGKRVGMFALPRGVYPAFDGLTVEID
jgi:hypothetical protein